MKRVCAGRSGGFAHGAAKCRKRENTPNGVGMARSKVARTGAGGQRVAEACTGAGDETETAAWAAKRMRALNTQRSRRTTQTRAEGSTTPSSREALLPYSGFFAT